MATMTGVSNKTEDYRGFTISRQEPPMTSAQWTANVASRVTPALCLDGSQRCASD